MSQTLARCWIFRPLQSSRPRNILSACDSCASNNASMNGPSFTMSGVTLIQPEQTGPRSTPREDRRAVATLFESCVNCSNTVVKSSSSFALHSSRLHLSNACDSSIGKDSARRRSHLHDVVSDPPIAQPPSAMRRLVLRLQTKDETDNGARHAVFFHRRPDTQMATSTPACQAAEPCSRRITP